tara:strand:+ start:551 stop:682 length:132 start_codon:yes stop_codon:yes gene_type:complete
MSTLERSKNPDFGKLNGGERFSDDHFFRGENVPFVAALVTGTT